MRKGAQLVERCVVAHADDAALAHGQPWLVHNRAFEAVAQGIKGLNRRSRTHQEAARRTAECGAHGGKRGERDTQGDEVARVRRLCLDARQETLEVVDRAQLLAQRTAQPCILHEFRHSVKARVNAVRREQRMLEPRAQEARPHRRARKVEDIEERILLAAVA